MIARWIRNLSLLVAFFALCGVIVGAAWYAGSTVPYHHVMAGRAKDIADAHEWWNISIPAFVAGLVCAIISQICVSVVKRKQKKQASASNSTTRQPRTEPRLG